MPSKCRLRLLSLWIRSTRWMAWCHEAYSLADARQWITAQVDLAKQGMAYEFAIFDHDGRFLGGCRD